MKLIGHCCGILVIVFMALGAANAHTSGSSFLSLRTQDGSVVAELDFDVRDLNYLLQLDRNMDGELTWGEIDAANTAIESLVLDRTRIGSGPQACDVTARAPLSLAEHGDGPYVRIGVTLHCADLKNLQVDHSRWFAFDPGHRALLEFVDNDGERTQAILSQATPQWHRQESRLTQIKRFLIEGAIHLFTGYDHLAFLVVLLLALARRSSTHEATPLRTLRFMLRQALVVITAFTIAHSTTLALAATGKLLLPSKPVEIAIAVSVLIAALLNLSRGASKHGWKLAFAFGLVHGLGFASALAELAGDHIDLLALGAFNIGIEAAQISIALLTVPLMAWIFRNRHSERLGVPAVSLVVAGIAAFWVVSRVTG